MSRVLIEDWAFDAICAHYAKLPVEGLTDDDKAVLRYLCDKMHRQAAHDSYLAGKRLDVLFDRIDNDDACYPHDRT